MHVPKTATQKKQKVATVIRVARRELFIPSRRLFLKLFWGVRSKRAGITTKAVYSTSGSKHKTATNPSVLMLNRVIRFAHERASRWRNALNIGWNTCGILSCCRQHGPHN